MSGVLSPPLALDLSVDDGVDVRAAVVSCDAVGAEGDFEPLTAGLAEVASGGVDGDACFVAGDAFAVWDNAVVLAAGLSHPTARAQIVANHINWGVRTHTSE